MIPFFLTNLGHLLSSPKILKFLGMKSDRYDFLETVHFLWNPRDIYLLKLSITQKMLKLPVL